MVGALLPPAVFTNLQLSDLQHEVAQFTLLVGSLRANVSNAAAKFAAVVYFQCGGCAKQQQRQVAELQV